MDTKITAAIVDDEQGNRENLLRMIGNYCPQIRISAICSSVTEARTVLPEAKPDILFLDIRLGDDTGFSLLGSLPEIPFEVIFVTSSESYSVRYHGQKWQVESPELSGGGGCFSQLSLLFGMNLHF